MLFFCCFCLLLIAAVGGTGLSVPCVAGDRPIPFSWQELKARVSKYVLWGLHVCIPWCYHKAMDIEISRNGNVFLIRFEIGLSQKHNHL